MPHLDDHPLASIFPLMPDGDIRSLADDIDANGQREPVWLYEGKLLDGRNRYRAAMLIDYDLRVEHYRGKDPLGFVISKNLHRRHLDESQRAMVAARIVAAKAGDLRFANLQIANATPIRAAVKSAAEAVSVSPRSVDSAREVQTNGTPELVAAVDAGEVSVSAAAEVASLPKTEQKKVVKGGPEKVKEKARELRQERKAEPARDAAADDTVVEEPPPADGAAVVEYGTPDGCIDALDQVCRKLKQARDLVSGVMAGPYAAEAQNLSESYTGCRLYRDGELVRAGDLGPVRFGIHRHSCQNIDELLSFAAGLKLVLGRLGPRPLAARPSGSPWDKEDSGEPDIPI